MTFTYYGQGMSSFYRNFVERLMSHLALRGTEILHQNVGDRVSTMKIRYPGEEGQMEVSIDLDNVQVRYTVDQERSGVRDRLPGSLTGVGPGGMVWGEQDAGDVIGGAAASGAYGAHGGYGSAHEAQTAFAGVLEETVRDVENELRAILEGQGEGWEPLRERSRQKREVGDARTDGLRELLDTLYSDILAVQEDLETAAARGLDVRKPEAQTDRAEALYLEAEAALEYGDHAVAKTKARAARAMIGVARDLLERDREE